MVLSKKETGMIVFYLGNRQQQKNWIADRVTEIAESADYSKRLAKSASYGLADPVAAKAQKIEAELERPRKWMLVADATWEKFKGTPHGELMELLFEKKSDISQICAKLNIVRRSLYWWREDILYYAAMKACEYGVLSV